MSKKKITISCNTFFLFCTFSCNLLLLHFFGYYVCIMFVSIKTLIILKKKKRNVCLLVAFHMSSRTDFCPHHDSYINPLPPSVLAGCKEVHCTLTISVCLKGREPLSHKLLPDVQRVDTSGVGLYPCLGIAGFHISCDQT